MKMKQMIKVTGSVALSAVLVTTATLSMPVIADENNSHNTEKTETVYSVLNGDGSVSDIVVSSWLHDEDGIRNLREKLNLTDVRNVKTDEMPEDDNGVYTWNADGNDLYYQGKATDALPVSVEISYILDGQEMAESELAGKSGHLKIHMHMENTYGETKENNGRSVIIHPLFVAGGMMMLDNDHVSDVRCEQGRIVNDGSRGMLLFASVPGLKETLVSAGLSKVSDKLNIGDDVVVECDVKDFERLPVMMTVSNEVETGDITDETDFIDALTSGVDALMEADERLLSGSRQLEEGTKQLIVDSLPLTSSSDSIRNLSKGSLTLNNGTTQLQASLKQYTDGVAKLNEGVSALYAMPDGAGKLSQAITTSQDAQHPSLLAGISALENGIAEFKNKIDTTMTSTDIAAMMESIETAGLLLSGMAKTIAEDLTVLHSLETALTDTVNGLGTVQSVIQISAGEISGALTQSVVALQQAKDSLPDGEAKTTIENALLTLNQQEETLTEAFATLQTAFASLSATDGTGMMGEVSQAIGQLNGLQNDNTDAETALAALQEIVNTSGESVETLLSMQDAIDEACDSLIQGAKSLEEGANEINEGIMTLEQQSKEGIDAIQNATSSLSINNEALNDGMAAVQNGTQSIAEQSGSFNEMADGLDALEKAFITLHEGASQLADGQQQFKEEGLSILKEKADMSVEEVNLLKTIVEEMQAMNKKYREYAGDNPNMQVITRYVFRTKTIEEGNE